MAREKVTEVDLKDPDFFEDVLIKYLFTDKEIREKVLPYLSDTLFHRRPNKQLIQTTYSLIDRFEKFPSAKEVLVDLDDDDTFDHFENILGMDISDFRKEYLMSEIETFVKKKMIYNIATDLGMGLDDDDWCKPESVDSLREAFSFSFDSNVGMDIFSSEERMYNFFHDDKHFVPTGIKNLDVLIQGGYHNKTLNLLMAGTNVGKSLAMAAMAVNNIYMNKKVLYISCEMSEEKITERVLANTFDVPISELPKMSRDRFHEKYEKFSQYKEMFVLKEYPPKRLNANHIRNLLKELKMKKGFVPDIIYVDYLALLSPINPGKNQNTYEALKIVSEELRAVAVEFDLPIVSAAQVGRDGISSTDIDLDDISESIGVTFTADTIVAMTQSDELRSAGKYCWTIIKNRYGQKKCWITVLVDFEKMRISYDEENDELRYATHDGSNPNPPTYEEKRKTDETREDAAQKFMRKKEMAKDNFFDFEV